MKRRTVLIFPFILGLYLLLNIYIGWHGALLINAYWPAVSTVWYGTAFALLPSAYLLARIRALPVALRSLLQWIGSFYFAVFEFSLLLLPIADLTFWLFDLAGVELSLMLPAAVYIGIMAGLLAWGYRNARSPIVRTHELFIDKKAGDLKELRVAVASDLHLGNMVGRRHLTRLVEKVNALKPDLVLLPGDVIDDDVEPFIRKQLPQLLKRLQARFGVYAVLGNHEYFGGQIEEYVSQMRFIGIPVLRDETVTVMGSFLLAGRKDRIAERMDPAGRLPVSRLLSQGDITLPVILMDHQPYGFGAAEEAGADLLLCGHTHRGQFAPNHWITRRIFELDWGYMQKGKMHVVVSSGFGTWGPPVRLASRSEIIELRIRFRE